MVERKAGFLMRDRNMLREDNKMEKGKQHSLLLRFCRSRQISLSRAFRMESGAWQVAGFSG